MRVVAGIPALPCDLSYCVCIDLPVWELYWTFGRPVSLQHIPEMRNRLWARVQSDVFFRSRETDDIMTTSVGRHTRGDALFSVRQCLPKRFPDKRQVWLPVPILLCDIFVDGSRLTGDAIIRRHCSSAVFLLLQRRTEVPFPFVCPNARGIL